MLAGALDEFIDITGETGITIEMDISDRKPPRMAPGLEEGTKELAK
jgi:hypothetical protein